MPSNFGIGIAEVQLRRRVLQASTPLMYVLVTSIQRPMQRLGKACLACTCTSCTLHSWPPPSSAAPGPGAIDLAVVSRHIAMRALRREVTRTGSKFYGGNEMLTKTRLLPSNSLQHRPFPLLVTKQWQRLCAAPASHVTSLPREPSDCVRLFN